MRRGTVSSAIAVAVITICLVAAGGPTASADPAPHRLALGDSVMLGAKHQLKNRGFEIVDADESRQAYKGPALLRKRGGSLPSNIVIHLGTNGTFPLSTCQRMVREAGAARRVFLVTVHAPRSWQNSNNRTIRNCAGSFPEGRVHVVDWHWAASHHPQWLYSDHIHLRPAGARAFARILDYAVDRYGLLN